MTEKELMSAVVEAARLFGYRVYHTYDSRRSAAGFPDLCLVRPPRLLFVELKSSTGSASQAQLDWLEALEACGQETHIWRPAEWANGTIVETLR